jgi:hypothetical protein
MAGCTTASNLRIGLLLVDIRIVRGDCRECDVALPGGMLPHTCVETRVQLPPTYKDRPPPSTIKEQVPFLHIRLGKLIVVLN